jgi:hypothetical protein
MNTRSKKRTNEKLPLDDLDNILNNTDASQQKKSTGAKRGRKKKQTSNDNNIDNPFQNINVNDNLDNVGDFNDGSNVDNDDETDQVAHQDSTITPLRLLELGSNSQHSRPMQNLNSRVNQNESTPFPNQTEDLRIINSHSDTSKTNSQIQNDFAPPTPLKRTSLTPLNGEPSNRTIPSRQISATNSRENSPLYYDAHLGRPPRSSRDYYDDYDAQLPRTLRAVSPLEPRFVHSNRNSTISPILNSGTNGPFGFGNSVPSNRIVPSRSSPSRLIKRTPLGSRDNSLNIFNNPIQQHMNFNTINEAIPSPFNEMTIYQLCLWLCKNPNVLQLANNIQLSMQTPAVEGLQVMSSTTISQNHEKTRVSRDFLEELKCLFLRVRNPTNSVFEELIRKIVKCEINSAEGIEWLQTAKTNFGDFRNKFVNGIEAKVKDFKKQRNLLV